MTFKRFLILLMAATALLWAGWVWTLFSVDPLATNWLGFLLFYLTLFLAATGTLCLAAVAVRKWRQPNLMLYHVVARSFRQAVALSFFSLALLMLQGTRALRWWNALALLLFVAGLETIVLRRHDKRRSSGSADAPLPPPAAEDGPTPLFVRKEVNDEGQDRLEY